MHLNTEELVDLAEGVRPESAAPHLAACQACQAQLRDLRAMLSAAQDAGVPEPSPLFWDHLSARVSAAVAQEPAPARLKPSRYAIVQGFAAVAAALLIAVALGSRASAPSLAPGSVAVATPPPMTVADAAPELLADVAPDSDPSLTLVASLSDGVDLETAREAGLAPHGSAEHAVTHMSDGELRELGRLLTNELARSGA